MWIKNSKSGVLYNSDQFAKLEHQKTKIIATFTDGRQECIGEFWTEQECIAILRNISLGLGNMAFINNTREGTICLKKKP